MTGRPGRFSPDELAVLRGRYEDQGVGTATLAAAFGVSRKQIENLVHHQNWRRAPGMRAGGPVFWTEERIETLRRRYVVGGEGPTRIARDFGCTRNAVVGKLNRLGWIKAADSEQVRAARSHNSRRQAERVRADKVRTQKVVVVRELAARPPREPKPPRPVREAAQVKTRPAAVNSAPVRGALARPWITRERGECAFAFGEPADLMSCCAPVAPGSPYCPACRSRMFQPSAPRQTPRSEIDSTWRKLGHGRFSEGGR